MKENRIPRLKVTIRLALAVSLLLAVGQFQIDGPRLTSIRASAILAECYEAFGAIIGVLAIGYIVFEFPERQILHGAKSRHQVALVVGILISTVIASRYAESSSQLYLLRVITGVVEGVFFLAGIVRVVHFR